MLKETGSSVRRVLGHKDEEGLLNVFKENFLHGQTAWPNEVPHNDEMRGLIAELNRELTVFMKAYGVAWREIPARNIHVFECELPLLHANMDSSVKGVFESTGQSIFLVDPLENHGARKVVLAAMLSHEMLHGNSFCSFRAVPAEEASAIAVLQSEHGEKIALMRRRTGNMIRVRGSGDLHFFRLLEEAVIEELAARFGAAHFRNITALHAVMRQHDRLLEGIRAEDRCMLERNTYVVFSGKRTPDALHAVRRDTY